MKVTKPFLCSYHHDGADWSVTLQAYDWNDANARCQKLGYLRLDGEVITTIPVKVGIFAVAICWIRNLIAQGHK